MNNNLKSVDTLADYLLLDLKDRYYYPYFYKTPYALEWGQWDEFNKWAKNNHPIQYFFRETLRLKLSFLYHSVTDYIYSLKCRFWRKYYIINLKSAPKDHWIDICEKIRLVNFELLCDYVENEMDNCSWDEEPHKSIGITIKECYNYITKIRPDLLKLEDELLTKGYSGDIDDLFTKKAVSPETQSARDRLVEVENEIKEKDEKYLIDIIKVREYLWS